MTTWLHELRLDDLVEALARATVLSALAFTVLVALRARSAAARELVGRWFLVALGLLPVLGWSGLSIGVLPSALAFGSLPAAIPIAEVRDALVLPPGAAMTRDTLPRWPSLAGWLALLWGSGTLLLVAFSGLGNLLAVHRLFGAAATALPESLRRRLDVPARVPVFVTPATMQPVVAGLLRQRIALPPTFLAWPLAQQRAVLAHELAHVERSDCRTALACQLARALWWPHPLVWLLERRVALAREQACDDRALGAQPAGDAPNYAATLVAVARQLRSAHRFHPPTLAMTTTSQLEARVRSLLRPDVNRTPVRWLARLVAASLVLLVGLGCAAAEAATDGTASPALEPAAIVATTTADHRGLPPTPPIVLAIDANGEVKYAGKPIGVSGVRALVARLAQDGAPRVIVACPKSAPANVLVRVIDEAKLGGATIVSTTTDSKPRLVFQPSPELTPELRRREAKVVVAFLVDENGDVVEPRLESSSDPQFGPVALAAVARWRFEPAIRDGAPVRTRMRVPMVFPNAAEGSGAGSDAQGESLHGVVLDADFDMPLDGARIEVVETGAVAITSTTGAFALRQPFGTYTVKVTKDGYTRQQQTVVVLDGRPTELRVRMKAIYVDLPPPDRR